MSFDETPKDPKELPKRPGLKPINGQKSMFDGKPKAPTQKEFEQKVHIAQEKLSDYNQRAADLFMKFSKAAGDKTLPQHKSGFNSEAETEMLQGMIQLAIEINNDPIEENNGMGSLTLITCLLKTALAQRDRLNELEYAYFSLQKKLESTALADYINKEINKALDKKKIDG
jgi:hypothetical protein